MLHTRSGLYASCRAAKAGADGRALRIVSMIEKRLKDRISSFERATVLKARGRAVGTGRCCRDRGYGLIASPAMARSPLWIKARAFVPEN